MDVSVFVVVIARRSVDGHVFVVFGLNVVDSSYLLLWLHNVVGGLWMVVYLFLWLFG